MTQEMIEASTSTPVKTTPKQRTRRPVKKAHKMDESTATPTSNDNATPSSPTTKTINVAQLFDMHDSLTANLKKETKKSKPRAHTIHPSTGESPLTKRVLHTTQHTTQHSTPRAHRTNSTPHHHQQHRPSVVRMNSSSPTGGAFATPAYADSPMAGELPMPPTFWRGNSPPAAPSAPTRMTVVELMSHFATGIVN